MEFVLFIIILLSFFIRSAWFQTFVAKTAADYFSSEWGTTVKVERFHIYDWEVFELEGLYIEDLKGDTLINAPWVDAALSSLSLRDQFAVIDIINLKDTRIKLQKYHGENKLNLQFLIDYFSSEKEKETSLFTTNIDEIAIDNAHLSYNDLNKPEKDFGVDYSHVELKNVGGRFVGFRNRKGVTTVEIADLTLKDKSGFMLEELNTYLLINPTKIKLEKLNIKTPGSNIHTEGVEMTFSDFRDFGDFVNAVTLFAGIDQSTVSINDLAYFVPGVHKIDHKVELSGEIKGPINDIFAQNLYLGLSPDTYFDGNIALKGLPDVKNTLMSVDINVLQSSKADLDQFDFRSLGMEDLVLPEQIGNLGTIFAMGKIEGFYNDFSIRMDVVTDAGVAAGGFICQLDTANQFYYDGNLSTAGMDLAKITDSKTFGNFTSDLNVKGRGLSINDIDVTVDGYMNKFDVNSYTYDEVKVNGKFHDKSFKGTVVVRDPNIELDFDGGININKAPYDFSFDATIQKANLYDLHFIKERETAQACFSIMAEGNASNFDDFTGLIYLNDVAYYENGKDYSFESIMFESKGNTNYHTIDIFSEFADITMEGEFNLDTLDNNLYYLGAKVLPSIFPAREDMEFGHEAFDLKVDINDLSKLTDLFFPALQVSSNTDLYCDYDSEEDEFQLSLNSAWVEYNNMRYAGIHLDTTQKFGAGDALFYTFDLMVDSVYLSRDNYIQNLKVVAEAFQDNLGTNVYWAANDSSNWANIHGDGYVMSKSQFKFDIHDSQIYSRMGLWNLDRDANIYIDSTSIHLDNLLASNDIQSIKLDGVISERPEDQLRFEIVDVSLENFNSFLGSSLELDGLLDLDGYVSNVYNDWYFDAYTFVEYLTVNGYYAGNLEAGSNWNTDMRRMELNGELIRPNGNTDFQISKGHFYLDREENLDFQFDFNKTDLNMVNAFMPDGMYIEGITDGTVYMKGNSSAPQFNGELMMKDAAFTMDMMNVTYTANGLMSIEPDMIFAPNGINVTDKFGSKALLVGQFFHQNFEQFNYDFFASFDKPFLVMNTNYNMNPLYYGDAFISGDISVNYENILDITVNAKSEKGTNITLPLYGSEEIVLQDFVTFVNNDSAQTNYEVDLEGINLNLSMDVTEDADIQLVFDEVVGDVMKGKGAGHIDMYIDQFYDFYMFGNYEITEGSYLFTLKDFINKKFQVKPGSEISWYGDPYEADINIKAYYPLKASVYDIMPENLRDEGDYKQKTEVECIMHLTQNLFNPNIGFDILLPRSDENSKTALKNLVSTEQEMNKQVFSLLILNRFIPRADAVSASSGGAGAAFGKATTSEVLSNQLSNMISNFSDDFDIGFNYSPGDQISNDEVAVAMSTQLFNDRLTVKTNVGVSHANETSQGNNSSLIGDVDVEYKLNPPEGNLRVHAFNESNEYDPTNNGQSKFTQGVGVFYQESFDSFGELWCKMGNLFRRRQRPGTVRKGKKDCKSCYDELTREERKDCRRGKKK